MIIYNRQEKKFEGISLEQAEFWAKAYPSVDVVDQLILRMPAWLDANPRRRYKDWKRFITNWLSRAQLDAERIADLNRRIRYAYLDEPGNRGNI